MTPRLVYDNLSDIGKALVSDFEDVFAHRLQVCVTQGMDKSETIWSLKGLMRDALNSEIADISPTISDVVFYLANGGMVGYLYGKVSDSDAQILVNDNYSRFRDSIRSGGSKESRTRIEKPKMSKGSDCTKPRAKPASRTRAKASTASKSTKRTTMRRRRR